MTNDAPQRLISDMRGVRYGEVLAVFARDGGLEAEVYGTQMLNDCPQEQWETLDADAIAAAVAEEAPRLRHLVGDADEKQMAFEIHGLILALHYEARFLKNPGAIEHANTGFENILLRYGKSVARPNPARR